MLLEEFEKRTGFYPTAEHYKIIEGRYSSMDIEKDEFCKMYKKNQDGIAESIQREAVKEAVRKERELAAEISGKDKEIERLKKQIEELQKKLDKAEGWEWKEVSEMSQQRYEELAAAGGTEEFSQEKARFWIEEEFGFSSGRIRVLMEIPKYQVSREGYLRKNGTVSRKPVYNATDWNYIRFDVGGWQYEVVNGQLYQYAD